MSLITRERALRNLNYITLSQTDALTLDAIVAGVSGAIEAFCQRRFAAQQYDELYSGDTQLRLILRNYPVLAVLRVAYNPVPVLNIVNTGANQRASVQVTETGLTLVRVAAGVPASDTSVTWSSYPALAQVAAAVSALGNGWSATVPSSYSNWPSADLRPLQGALNCLNNAAAVRLHTSELQDFQVDAERGWLLRPQIVDDTLMPPLGLHWHGGANFWRVIYTAGFADIPDDVQEACAEWSAVLYWQTKRDPGLAQESVPGLVSRVALQGMPATVQQLILPYRTRRLAVR